MPENEFVSSATCDRCLSGIKTQLEGLSRDIGEVKTAIGEGKKESNRRVLLWITVVTAIVGVLSNIDKLSALFK